MLKFCFKVKHRLKCKRLLLIQSVSSILYISIYQMLYWWRISYTVFNYRVIALTIISLTLEKSTYSRIQCNKVCDLLNINRKIIHKHNRYIVNLSYRLFWNFLYHFDDCTLLKRVATCQWIMNLLNKSFFLVKRDWLLSFIVLISGISTCSLPWLINVCVSMDIYLGLARRNNCHEVQDCKFYFRPKYILCLAKVLSLQPSLK